jgi:FHA domain
MARMERGDAENVGDDGIVAEDVTQLVEHIELTSPHRLSDAHDWELATPIEDLEDAPILIGELPDHEPAIAGMSAGDDPEFFTETQADLTQLLNPGERLSDHGAALAAERARWQQRVDELRAALAQRDRLLAERERRIEELTARLDALAPPRANETAESAPSASDAMPETPAPDDLPADADYTQELPIGDMPPEAPLPGVLAVPRLRRYLIGLDIVGCVHEVAGRRMTIGRTRDNELRIVDPTVSRLHAMLSIRDGEAMLIDANSRNGIFVNGIQVRYAKLDDGDLVTFGTVRFRYRVGSDPVGGATGSA